MEHIKKIFGVKSSPKSDTLYGDSTIFAPYGGNMSDIRSVPQAQSGMARASWFAENMMPYGSDEIANTPIQLGTYKTGFGSLHRGVNGVFGGSALTDSFYTAYNVVGYPDQKTLQADSVGGIWDVQMNVSKGLNYPNNDQVYVSQDTQSLWS